MITLEELLLTRDTLILTPRGYNLKDFLFLIVRREWSEKVRSRENKQNSRCLEGPLILLISSTFQKQSLLTSPCRNIQAKYF